jgi:hypothetical protein
MPLRAIVARRRSRASSARTAFASSASSKTQPVKFLAVFVVDTNETDLTIPFGN